MRNTRIVASLKSVSIWGTGLLVMVADTDAGNVVTAAQAGAQWGYRMLPLLLALTPLLYVVQELTVRLGIFTGQGFGELIRERFGAGWAWLAAGSLAVATAGSLITEFTGIAGIGELYGLPRALTLSASVSLLLVVVATGSYRRAELASLLIGAFELAFFAVAWNARPDASEMLRHASDLPLNDTQFLYLAAAMIGAVFNPWMVFYQQSAIADKGLSPSYYRAENRGTAIGAVLTQSLTAAVLIAMAATTFVDTRTPVTLDSVGQICTVLSGALGGRSAKLLFSMGVLGAAMVAAVVSSLALAWGVGEIAGYRRSLEMHPSEAPRFYGVYAGGLIACATLVWRVPNLVWLNIAAQALNVLLLPLVLGLLVTLAATALPDEWRLRGWYYWTVVCISGAVCLAGFAGAFAGYF